MFDIRPAWLLLAFVLATAEAWAQGVGRVQFVSGQVQVERGAQRLALQPAAAIEQGDLILTGADGHLQLVMSDAAHVSLRPNSRMRIDRYEFDHAKPGAGVALLSLITGALQAFTGEIVVRDRDQFKMKTPLASVGIRGSGNILAHLEDGGTVNHTLTGSHIVSSFDAQGIERALVSLPGQTVQVRPGQAPRFIPTPTFIMASASPATRAESTAKAESAAEKPASAAQAGTAEPTAASTSASSSSTSSSGSTATTTSTTAAAGSSTTGPPGGEPAPTLPATTVTSVIPGSGASTGTSQATTATVGASIAAAQLAPNSAYETLMRFFVPLPGGGYQGALGQSSVGSGGGVVLDAAGRLIQASRAVVGTFLAGPGALPPGYTGASYAGTVTFSGGEHHDGFRASDGSVILGRWTGGTVNVSADSGNRIAFDLGPRSLAYDVTTPTVAGVLGSFTGTANYGLAGATAPTDATGSIGAVTSASVFANFSARTVSGTFALGVGGRNFSLAGVSDLSPGSPRFTFASSLQNLTIGCTGSCSSAPYLGTVNGLFAGTTGQWMSVSYRINPDRGTNGSYSDYVVGSIALSSGTAPTIGIVLPQSGTANLVWTGVDPARSSINFPQATGSPTISGALQANFNNQTASFTATVAAGSSLPAYVASATAIPIVGAGFSASTEVQRPSGVGSMSVSCNGSGCGASGSTFGRFDGLFRNGSGTSGIASLLVGDSAGSYDLTASFGIGASSASAVAADASRAVARLANADAAITSRGEGQRLVGSRTGRWAIP